jgi:hypothetical protein
MLTKFEFPHSVLAVAAAALALGSAPVAADLVVSVVRLEGLYTSQKSVLRGFSKGNSSETHGGS